MFGTLHFLATVVMPKVFRDSAAFWHFDTSGPEFSLFRDPFAPPPWPIDARGRTRLLLRLTLISTNASAPYLGRGLSLAFNVAARRVPKRKSDY